MCTANSISAKFAAVPGGGYSLAIFDYHYSPKKKGLVCGLAEAQITGDESRCRLRGDGIL
jgi:hypothetical protein